MQLLSHVDYTPGLHIQFTSHEYAWIHELLEAVYPEVRSLNINLKDWCYQKPQTSEVRAWRTFCVKNQTVRELLRLIRTLEVDHKDLRAALHPLHFSCLYQLLTDKDFRDPRLDLCLFKAISTSNQLWWNSFYHVMPFTLTLKQLRQEGVDLFSQEALFEQFQNKKR